MASCSNSQCAKPRNFCGNRTTPGGSGRGSNFQPRPICALVEPGEVVAPAPALGSVSPPPTITGVSAARAAASAPAGVVVLAPGSPLRDREEFDIAHLPPSQCPIANPNPNAASVTPHQN